MKATRVIIVLVFHCNLGLAVLASDAHTACPAIAANQRPALVFIGQGAGTDTLQVARFERDATVKTETILDGRDLQVVQLSNAVFLVTAHASTRSGHVYAVDLERGKIRHLLESTAVRCPRSLPGRSVAMLLEVRPRQRQIVLHTLSLDSLDLAQQHCLSAQAYPDDYPGFFRMSISPDLKRVAYVVPHTAKGVTRWTTYTLKMLDLSSQDVHELVPSVGVQIGSFSSFGRGVVPLTWLDDSRALFQDMDTPQDVDIFDHDHEVIHRFKTIDVDTMRISECMSLGIPLSLDGGSLEIDPLTGHILFRREWILDLQNKSRRSAILPFSVQRLPAHGQTQIRCGPVMVHEAHALCVAKVVAPSGEHIAYALRPWPGNALFAELYATTQHSSAPVKVTEGDYLPVRPVGWIE